MGPCQRSSGGAVAQHATFHRLIALGIGFLLAAIAATNASGQSPDADTVTLEGTYTDVQFLAGESVRIRADVSDDVFAAGRNVIFDAATARNAIAAGYDVELRGGSVTDMIAAGANINIAGTIEDDLIAGARSLRISSNGFVGGDARIAAETIEMEGRVGGGMRAAARRITIDGEIGGKADLLARRIVISSGAVINGDLVYRSDAEPEIAEGATITGEIRQVSVEMPDLRSIGLAILGIGLLIVLSWAVAMLVLVAVVQLTLPGLMTNASDRLQSHPWSNLGRGVVILLLAIVLAGVLLVSILGIPLGGALAVTILVLLLLGFAVVSYSVGLLIRGWLRGSIPIATAGRVGWTIAGAVVLSLVGLIPIIGGIAAGLAVAAGLGAAAAELWRRLRPTAWEAQAIP